MALYSKILPKNESNTDIDNWKLHFMLDQVGKLNSSIHQLDLLDCTFSMTDYCISFYTVSHLSRTAGDSHFVWEVISAG